MNDSRKHLAQALQDPAIAAVNFTLDGNRYDAKELSKVSLLLRAGKIRVLEESLDGSAAGYTLDTNTLYWAIGAPRPTNAHWLVHEAIHIVQDANKYICTLALAEAAAYLAQVVFFVASCADNNSLAARTTKATQLEAKAAEVGEGLRELFKLLAVASKVARQKNLYQGNHVALSAFDVVELTALIGQSPRYSAMAERQFATDGV